MLALRIEINKELDLISKRKRSRDASAKDPVKKEIKCKDCKVKFTRKSRKSLRCPTCTKSRNMKNAEERRRKIDMENRGVKVVCEECFKLFVRKSKKGKGATHCPQCRAIANEDTRSKSVIQKTQCGFCSNKEKGSEMAAHKGKDMCSVCWGKMRDEQDAGRDNAVSWMEENEHRGSGLHQAQEFASHSAREIEASRSTRHYVKNKVSGVKK